MVNLSSGAQTRISGIVAGVMTLVVALLLGAFVAWIPVAALSGVLIVVGLRMIDTDPLRFLESRATVLDFSVVLAVVAVALFVGLIAASATGRSSSRSSSSCANRSAATSSGARASSASVHRPGTGPRPRSPAGARRGNTAVISNCRAASSSARRTVST